MNYLYLCISNLVPANEFIFDQVCVEPGTLLKMGFFEGGFIGSC